MITDTEILELVIKHFGEEWCEEDGDGWVEFSGRPSAFLKFAQEIYELGYNKGYDTHSFDMED